MNLESGVLQIHIEDIIPNRFQPRLTFDEQGLKELADSIREHGIIQPLVLRKLGDKYEIIAGERRYKAAQIAGLTTVPAVISNIDDQKSAEVALVENVQRRDLTAIEEARSYKNLLDKGYLTQEQLAKRMGLSQPAIANKLRLLNLDEEVQQALLEERISERHARTLLTLTDKAAQREWLHRVINERLTVRQLDIELKKLKSANDLLVSSDDDDDATGDVPIVSAIPSIEDIKANAVDISEANKISTQEQNNDSFEMLDIGMPTPQNQPITPLFNDPIGTNDNSFTTATTIPEFNIATPNSSSTFVQTNNINNVDDNKFFTFEPQEPAPAPVFTPLSTSTAPSSLGEFEIFDAQGEDSFISATSISEPTVQPNPMESVSTFQPVNNGPEMNLDLSANNKYFTPPTEVSQQVTIQSQLEREVDPMQAVSNLVDNQSPAFIMESEKNLKEAISTIRTCIEGLGNKGYFIDVEEIDFDSNYQITMRIHKDN